MLIPDVLEFDTKRFIWRAELKKLHSKHTRREELAVQVRRDHVFDDSFDSLRDLSNTEWKMRFAIEFKDEEGVDQGGLTKEWFMALSK